MAQIDTSIYSRVGTGGSLANLTEGYQQGMQLRATKNELQQQEKAIAEQQTLRDIIKNNTGADGVVNRQGVVSGLAQGGLGDQIPVYQKQWADSDKAATDQQMSQFKLTKEKIDYTNGAIASLLSDQNLTHDAVIGHAANLVQRGIMTPQEGEQFVRTLPGNPEHLRGYLTQLGMQGLDAAKRMQMLTPNVEAVNLGGHTQMVDKNAITNPNIAGQSFQRSATPGEDEVARHNRATEGIALRGQDLKNSVTSKPLPTAALKLQQDDMDAIGSASALEADLGAIIQQIDGGSLNLGFFANSANRAKNYMGRSDQESRNLASLEANLERLRNESLRLNKGVQTDGDAQRAWNELVENINDPKVVRQRLQEIQKINARAVMLRQNNMDVLRANYGLDPLDTSQIRSVPAAVGGREMPAQQQDQLQKNTASAPKPGAMSKGYAFMGGNPNDRNNWKKVTK